MNRDQRRQIAEETVRILDSGHYRLPSGTWVSLKDDLEASLRQTVLYRPGDFDTLSPKISSQKCDASEIVVTDETTLQAASRAVAKGASSVCCLNFASAKNPGGGFLGGSQAQEESLARSSGLYASLTLKSEFYEYNRNLSTALYSDFLIYSPHVPVFREEDGSLLAAPYHVAFITAPAINAGAVKQNEPQNVKQILPTMRQRAENVLAVASANGCDHLILGAWGCGVFRNDPVDVAQVFHDALSRAEFSSQFRKITFAVYDTSKDQQGLQAFQRRFGRSS